MAAAFAIAGAGFGVTSQAHAAVFAPAQGASLNAQSMTIDVQHWRHGPPGAYTSRGYRPRGYARGPRGHVGYRHWHRRPYYGTIIGGIALGALLAGSAYYAYSGPPAPGLCWYWADPYQRQGYWDYC